MIPVFIFAATLLVYLLTLAPTISFFDSGEMIAGAYTLGVAHPPGYPVYVTLGRLFTFLPLNSVAFRVNLMSAFFASMSSVMVYYIARSIFQDDGPADDGPDGAAEAGEARGRLFVGAPEAAGIFSAFAFAFCFNHWAWAVVSKFYTLNSFVVACILMLLIRWRRTLIVGDGERGSHPTTYLYAISFICGIAAVVHISQLPLFFTYAFYVFLVIIGRRHHAQAVPSARAKDAGRGQKKRPPETRPATFVSWLAGALKGLYNRFELKALITAAFFFLLGHSIYLHVPIRALQEPLINWGGATDWTQFKWVYNREGYPTVGGVRSWGLFWEQLKSFNLVREFGWAGVALILAGFAGLFKKDRLHFAVLLFGAVTMTSAIIILGNPIKENIFLLEQFYIPVYLFVSVAMGGAVYLFLTMRPSAAWIFGLTLPFIFIGDVPMAYLAKALTGAKVSPEKTFLMGMEYPPFLYFVFFAVVAAVLTAGMKVLARGRGGQARYVFMAAAILMMLLYPAYQLKSNYWKNDRSRNYIAYDMGNAELNFAPEFAVLFTWGDSGAFPMWYLQDVEQKRPDVLLVHTPHLSLEWFLESIRRGPARPGDIDQIREDYGLLRNYNGVKGIENLLKIPADFRAPEFMIKDIIQFNQDRPFAFDYSSRYSIRMPHPVDPYGITYRTYDKELYLQENLRTWQFLVTRGLPNPDFSLDLDDSKAVTIYGYVHSDIGSRYLDMGLDNFARKEFALAVQYSPNLWGKLGPYIR